MAADHRVRVTDEREVRGDIYREPAKKADEVYLLVASIPLRTKPKN